jgi:hypothetical protein
MKAKIILAMALVTFKQAGKQAEQQKKHFNYGCQYGYW